jgi:hypothetical protein
LPRFTSPRSAEQPARGSTPREKLCSDCWTRTSDPAVNRGKPGFDIHGASEKQADRESETPRDRASKTPHVQFPSNDAAADSTTSALEKSLLLAAEAGRFDVVAVLAKELEARRLTGSNVATLDSARRSRK